MLIYLLILWSPLVVLLLFIKLMIYLQDRREEREGGSDPSKDIHRATTRGLTPSVMSPRREVKSTWLAPTADSQLWTSPQPHIAPVNWTTAPIIVAVPAQSPAHDVGVNPASPRLEQQPPETLPFIPPAGWNPTPIIPFLNDGLPVSTETPLASRNEPLITPVISKATSPNRAVETDRAPPFALEQQPLNTQSKKTPPQRKTRKPSEVTTQSIADLSPAEEGGRKPRTSYAVVRSAKLRKAAIQIHGRNCIACGLSFDERYGEDLAKGYIDIHHLNSISAGVRNTDPAEDLVPLCRNCHVMADRLARHHTSPPRSIGELKNMLFPEFRFQEKEAIPAVKANKSPVKTRIPKVRENKPKKSS